MNQTQPPTPLICPKCGSDMRAYERNGVTVDQCTGCRGVFLDRGELERLVDAESAYYEAPRQPDRPRYDGGSDRYSEDPRGRSRSEHGSQGRRREGFLGELFG